MKRQLNPLFIEAQQVLEYHHNLTQKLNAHPCKRDQRNSKHCWLEDKTLFSSNSANVKTSKLHRQLKKPFIQQKYLYFQYGLLHFKGKFCGNAAFKLIKSTLIVISTNFQDTDTAHMIGRCTDCWSGNMSDKLCSNYK